MAMGLPIVLVSPSGEASNILADDGAGLWVESGNPAALAEAALKLFANDTLRASLAASSLRAAERHTRKHQAELFISALENGCNYKS
jgi:glycosyltransferase involved in cell wall biosynthesis